MLINVRFRLLNCHVEEQKSRLREARADFKPQSSVGGGGTEIWDTLYLLTNWRVLPPMVVAKRIRLVLNN